MIRSGTALVLLLALTPALAAGQKKGGVFRDPEDGHLDMSEWLLTLDPNVLVQRLQGRGRAALRPSIRDGPSWASAAEAGWVRR